ncbi:MAG: nuclear transport factor 2 family protein [Actinomycetota bacterium]|nr:nuclear transport factor 2 family protein [Actinomycetota bacterium]
MSERNVELHRRIYRALSTADVDALVALCDPNIEIRSVFAEVGGAVYHAHEGVRGWQRDLEESFGGEFRVEPGAYFDLGERTLVFGVLRGRGGQSGVEVAMEAYGVATWRNSLCVSHKAYQRKEDALSDVGVSEDELGEPIAP